MISACILEHLIEILYVLYWDSYCFLIIRFSFPSKDEKINNANLDIFDTTGVSYTMVLSDN